MILTLKSREMAGFYFWYNITIFCLRINSTRSRTKSNKEQREIKNEEKMNEQNVLISENIKPCSICEVAVIIYQRSHGIVQKLREKNQKKLNRNKA